MLTLVLLSLVGAPDVQLMIDAAKPGAVVELPAGEWVGDLRIRREVTIRGAGIGKTILRGSKKGSVVRIEATEGAVKIERLSITGGDAIVGGGISHAGRAALTLEDVELSGNRGACGGALQVYGAPVTLVRVSIHDNRGTLSAGACLSGDAPIVLRETRFSKNVADGVGALIGSAARIELVDVTFEENVSESGEAAHASFSCDKPGCAVLLDRVVFGPARAAAPSRSRPRRTERPRSPRAT
ncbi:hypothetical protein L6R52_22605 [Myxococcota bacterium]|nr:hypothetical protein [Myxococcota bacterium]